jgi:hypothetical protein
MKKSNLHGALGALLAVALFLITVPISPGTSAKAKPDLKAQERSRVKRGLEVGNRVRDLKKYNKNVRAALSQFEKNEKGNHNKPKLDEAVSVIQDPAGGSSAVIRAHTMAKPFRNVSLKPQDPDYSEYGVEMIVIPTFYDDHEWQGNGNSKWI